MCPYRIHSYICMCAHVYVWFPTPKYRRVYIYHEPNVTIRPHRLLPSVGVAEASVIVGAAIFQESSDYSAWWCNAMNIFHRGITTCGENMFLHDGPILQHNNGIEIHSSQSLKCLTGPQSSIETTLVLSIGVYINVSIACRVLNIMRTKEH